MLASISSRDLELLRVTLTIELDLDMAILYQGRYTEHDDSMTSLAATISTCLHMVDCEKNDFIHKTGSTQHVAMPPGEDQAMAMGNMHKNLVKIVL